MQTLYSMPKAVHIIGFITGIGIVFSTFLAYRQFWKLYETNTDNGMAAFRAFKKLQVAGMLGLLIVLVTGIGMLAIVDWVFTQIIWFQVKLVLVGLIFVNGFTLGRASTLQLHAFLEKSVNRADHPEVKKLQGRLNTFQVIQLSIYLVIILLSTFRFA